MQADFIYSSTPCEAPTKTGSHSAKALRSTDTKGEAIDGRGNDDFKQEISLAMAADDGRAGDMGPNREVPSDQHYDHGSTQLMATDEESDTGDPDHSAEDDTDPIPVWWAEPSWEQRSLAIEDPKHVPGMAADGDPPAALSDAHLKTADQQNITATPMQINASPPVSDPKETRKPAQYAGTGIIDPGADPETPGSKAKAAIPLPVMDKSPEADTPKAANAVATTPAEGEARLAKEAVQAIVELPVGEVDAAEPGKNVHPGFEKKINAQFALTGASAEELVRQGTAGELGEGLLRSLKQPGRQVDVVIQPRESTASESALGEALHSKGHASMGADGQPEAAHSKISWVRLNPDQTPLGDHLTSSAPTSGDSPSAHHSALAGESGDPHAQNPGVKADPAAAAQAQTRAFLPSEPANIIQQMVQRAEIQNLKNRQEVKIQLKPEHLGHIRMNISTENHQVIVKVMAEIPAVKQAIESNLQQLRSGLQQHGLDIHKFDVFVGQQNTGRQRDRPMNSFRRGGKEKPNATVETVTARTGSRAGPGSALGPVDRRSASAIDYFI